MSKQEYLYRFRSCHALLDGHHELEEQNIYFCPPDKLNDPLEGFKDVFWRGDKVVWRNLLRHYLLNFMQATTITAIMGKEFTPDLCDTLVHQTEHDLPEAPIRETYSTACESFFKDPASELFVTSISLHGKAVRRNELIFYLRVIQPLATKCVHEAFGARGLPLLKSTHGLDSMIEDMRHSLKQIFQAHTESPPDLSDAAFTASEHIMLQQALIHEFNDFTPVDLQPWMFVLRDFPSYYVTSLEQLLYPDWHVACFVADPTNSSMWGAYADSHRGICLKFKTRNDGYGLPVLDLYRPNGWSGGKNGIVTHYAYVPHRFEEILYTAEFPEVDFFESLGALPRYKLSEFWFRSDNAEQSTTATRMLCEDEEWRKEYWHKFSAMFRTKSSEWQHEKERRLILYSNLERFDDATSRNLKYRFSDLAGVVFGIKTTTEDKLKIMRIIKEKCASEGREDFEFHQAYYSNISKKIELAPLELLNVK